ncbi:MAG: response regulator [Chlorobiales bacterium]|nr:response regulator [Chlorobiales bacterium]
MARILSIEDSIYQRTKIARVLETEGHLVLQAADGVEGLMMAATSDPDCILCDLIMPQIGGLELLQQLHEKNLKVPVIILTADIQDTTREECLALGAVNFLNKPVQPEELLAAVRRVLAQSQSSEANP